MVNSFVMRLVQSIEFIKNKGCSAFIKELFYINRKAIVLEKNLLDVNVDSKLLEKENVKFIELLPETFEKYIFPLKDRYLKAKIYFKKGYRGFALVRENKIIGDTWYYASKLSDKSIDIKWLGFKEWSDKYIYTFDIYLLPEERGKYLSSILQNNAMYSLKRKGFVKAYTYIWADNISSIWMTRVTNKWKEIKKVKLSRLFIIKIGEKNNKNA